MNGLRLAILSLVGVAASFGGATPVQAQFYGGYGGYGYGGYGPGYGYGGHQYSGYYGSGYASGAYPFNNWYVSPYRAISPGYVGTYGNGFGYTTNYGMAGVGYGPSYGLTPVIAAPNPVYGTTTTIIRGGPTGGVINYSNNGNGYTYAPDSAYPTLIQQQPTLGLSRTYVPPSPPPVVIENRPPGSNSAGLSNSISTLSTPSVGTIKLVCPKTASGALSYALNGHPFTIEPGYSQTFREDRVWNLEFKRGGEGSEVARYSLKAGTYTFAVGAKGWELQQQNSPVSSELPPAPLPDPSLGPVPSLSPSPTPLPPP